MADDKGLAEYDIIGFVTIVDVERAKSFYRDTLGLTLVEDERPFALVFDANGTMLRLAIGKEALPTAGTVLGWRVTDISAVVTKLKERGVQFQRYGFMQQDELGVWSAPGGAKVAWFLDPDGNTLSISEHPR